MIDTTTLSHYVVQNNVRVPKDTGRAVVYTAPSGAILMGRLRHWSHERSLLSLAISEEAAELWEKDSTRVLVPAALCEFI